MKAGIFIVLGLFSASWMAYSDRTESSARADRIGRKEVFAPPLIDRQSDSTPIEVVEEVVPGSEERASEARACKQACQDRNAGVAWAARNHIDSEDLCNGTPEFVRGCREFVDLRRAVVAKGKK